MLISPDMMTQLVALHRQTPPIPGLFDTSPQDQNSPTPPSIDDADFTQLRSPDSPQEPKKKQHRMPSIRIPYLEHWLNANGGNLYPSREQKETLATEANVQYCQVRLWTYQIRSVPDWVF